MANLEGKPRKKLWDYVNATAEIHLTNGRIIRGLVDEYINAEDNESGKESIIINQYPSSNGVLVEIMEDEIKSITILEELDKSSQRFTEKKKLFHSPDIY